MSTVGRSDLQRVQRKARRSCARSRVHRVPGTYCADVRRALCRLPRRPVRITMNRSLSLSPSITIMNAPNSKRKRPNCLCDPSPVRLLCVTVLIRVECAGVQIYFRSVPICAVDHICRIGCHTARFDCRSHDCRQHRGGTAGACAS